MLDLSVALPQALRLFVPRLGIYLNHDLSGCQGMEDGIIVEQAVPRKKRRQN
jgi:hypothetical protein